MKKKSSYEVLLDTMPVGVERAILRIVTQRVGKENAILGHEMFAMLKSLGFELKDQRQMRLVVKDLRRQQHCICSAPGESGGYWMARDRAEYEAFVRDEFRKKIIDLSTTLRAMNAGADDVLGPVVLENQETLF